MKCRRLRNLLQMKRFFVFEKKKFLVRHLIVAAFICCCVLFNHFRQFTFSDSLREIHNHTNWTYQTDLLTAYHKLWVGFPDLRSVDCSVAFSKAAKNEDFPKEVNRTFPSDYVELSKDCEKFRGKLGFYRYPEPLDDEKAFPLAFIILFHKDLDQVLFLLRAIYRPHNVYCLSVDTKSSIEFLDAVRSVVRCLPNVFVASKLENIVYAGFSRLMADLNCYKDLLRHPVQWKYTINMPGQQFPLRSNPGLVRILRLYNGTNDIEGNTIREKELMQERTSWVYTYKRINNTDAFEIVKSSKTHAPVPHGLDIVKGSAYGTFSRAFIEFVMSNSVALDLLNWTKAIYSPDEFYWAMLNYAKNINVPGGYTGQPDLRPYRTSLATWEWTGPCATKYIRHVCIYSTEDLLRLKSRPEFFLNKFYINHHPTALHCLDQLIYNETFAEALNTHSSDTDNYK